VSDALEKIGKDSPRQTEVVKRAEEIRPPLESDRLIYRIAVTALSLTLLGALAGGFVLAWSVKEIPQVLVALGSAAVGGLAGLLAPSPTRRR